MIMNTELKRGIVIVRVPTKEELITYFQKDEYVRDGYMTLNAKLSVAHKPLATLVEQRCRAVRIEYDITSLSSNLCVKPFRSP